jgi:nicotinamide-nucleotide amidase
MQHSHPVIVEIVNTGSELMLGNVLNTHQQWLCKQLAGLGYPVTRQTAVPDTSRDIKAAVVESLSRADLVITTGGLGPTSDDLTRTFIADLFGRALIEDPSVVSHIATMFSARRRTMPASTRVQALVPAGAAVLMNAFGTAPGLILESAAGQFQPCPSLLIMLPGPPRELRPMFLNQVAPFLRKRFPITYPFLVRTFRTTGLGESALEEKIVERMRPLVEAGLELGYCARIGEVDVRLVTRGPDREELLRTGETTLRELLGPCIFGMDEQDLEEAVVRQLTSKGASLALAESCTGGYIAHRITNVPGASAVFRCGFVTYSNESKQQILGVRQETLEAHGAVSEPVAREMAEGARLKTGATYALAVTGIAGPTGGSAEKPVGTVLIALASPSETAVLKQLNAYERETFKFVTSQQALDLLRRTLLAN